MEISLIISPLVILFAIALYGFIHSLLASFGFKKWIQHRLGNYTTRYYRLAYNFFAVISFLPVLALPAILPDRELYKIQVPWIYLTLAVQALAVVALAVGVVQTGVWHFFGLKQLLMGDDAQDGELFVKGLYCYVRHPLYTAGIIFIWFVPVMSWNVLALNIGLSLYFIIGAIVEERKLVQTYGKPYLDYQRQVPMLIPRYKRSC